MLSFHLRKAQSKERRFFLDSLKNNEQVALGKEKKRNSLRKKERRKKERYSLRETKKEREIKKHQQIESYRQTRTMGEKEIIVD